VLTVAFGNKLCWFELKKKEKKMVKATNFCAFVSDNKMMVVIELIIVIIIIIE